MFSKNTPLAVSIFLSLSWSNAIADSKVHIDNLPSEAGRIAEEVESATSRHAINNLSQTTLCPALHDQGRLSTFCETYRR
jgi:hypothetical protein